MKIKKNRCKFCNITYTGHGLIYCSRSCRAKDTGVGRGIKTGKLVECFICKKPIWRKGSLLKKFEKFYCSRNCLGVDNVKRLNLLPRTWMKGKNNWAWKGGVTPENLKLRKSKEYALWRTAVFMRDDYTCQICNQRGGRLQVDHIKSFAHYPELRLAIDNGRTLCVECHKQTDNYLVKARWINI